MTEKQLMTQEEKLKCNLLNRIISDNAMYSFDLTYRNDINFQERVEGFLPHVKGLIEATVDEIVENYGREGIGEDLYFQYRELQKSKGE